MPIPAVAPEAWSLRTVPGGELYMIPEYEVPATLGKALPKRGKARAKGDGIADGREPGR